MVESYSTYESFDLCNALDRAFGVRIIGLWDEGWDVIVVITWGLIPFDLLLNCYIS